MRIFIGAGIPDLTGIVIVLNINFVPLNIVEENG